MKDAKISLVYREINPFSKNYYVVSLDILLRKYEIAFFWHAAERSE